MSGKNIKGSDATWSQCLKWALDSIPDDIILYLQEDYFLKSQVRTSMIDDAVRLMLENKDIKCIHLTDQGVITSGQARNFLSKDEKAYGENSTIFNSVSGFV